MKKSNKKKIEEFIRVDHAGERGAIKIYEGQLLALNTFIKDEELKKTIEEMKEHEHEHANYFEQEIKKRNVKPKDPNILFNGIQINPTGSIPYPEDMKDKLDTEYETETYSEWVDDWKYR